MRGPTTTSMMSRPGPGCRSGPETPLTMRDRSILGGARTHTDLVRFPGRGAFSPPPRPAGGRTGRPAAPHGGFQRLTVPAAELEVAVWEEASAAGNRGAMAAGVRAPDRARRGVGAEPDTGRHFRVQSGELGAQASAPNRKEDHGRHLSGVARGCGNIMELARTEDRCRMIGVVRAPRHVLSRAL